jgi:hypothetical protein
MRIIIAGLLLVYAVMIILGAVGVLRARSRPAPKPELDWGTWRDRQRRARQKNPFAGTKACRTAQRRGNRTNGVPIGRLAVRRLWV